jgi:oligopeptide transport system ATP-binding protein
VSQHLLEVRNLTTCFQSDRGPIVAVDDVSFHVAAGETLGIVGESGSGKSVTSLSIMRLVAQPAGQITGGEIIFEGEDLLRKSEAKMRKVRGNRIAMIYQEPMTSLNPVFNVGMQITEALTLHLGLTKRAARRRAIELLQLVGIPSPEQRVDAFPHQLSGGMRQRVMIAMALACRPRLLIADEPTTALDATVQAEIIELLRRLRREFDMSMLLITHDFGVIAELCDRVAVMYAGRIVEEADVFSLFRNPIHPYTEGLLASVPRIDDTRATLRAISGTPPNPLERGTGCRFAPRCPYAMEVCREKLPDLIEVGPGRSAACFLSNERAA